MSQVLSWLVVTLAILNLLWKISCGHFKENILKWFILNNLCRLRLISTWKVIRAKIRDSMLVIWKFIFDFSTICVLFLITRQEQSMDVSWSEIGYNW